MVWGCSVPWQLAHLKRLNSEQHRLPSNSSKAMLNRMLQLYDKEEPGLLNIPLPPQFPDVYTVVNMTPS